MRIFIFNTFLFRPYINKQKDMKKRTKETSRSPLFIGVTTRFARVCEKKKCLSDARFECVCVCVCVLANYLD